MRSNTIRFFYEDIVNKPRKIVSELIDPFLIENSVYFDNLPEKFPNKNTPWFSADEHISGKFGEVRLFHESEREEMADVIDMALHLGYNYDKICLLTSS